MTSFMSRSTRSASCGASSARAARFRSGSPIRRNSVRNTSVTTLRTLPTSAPVIPSNEPAASGIFSAMFLARSSALFATSVFSSSALNSGSSWRSLM